MQTLKTDPCILLVDNGSYRAQSTLSLRSIAERVSERNGYKVNPVSLLHSTKVPAEDLNGIPAEIFEPYIKKQHKAGIRNFLVLPLFFGHSAAIYEYLPQRTMHLQERLEGLSMQIAPCMVDLTEESDTMVAEVLAQLVREKIAAEGLEKPAVTLVDH